MDIQWMHAAAGILGALCGAIGGIFVGGYRVGKIEGKLTLSIAESEKRIEDKVDIATAAFDETLKGLRQKINDVEKDALLRYLPKEEFNDFRGEYREDIRELKALIRNGNGH